jgi:dTDP-4-amino-4,6-dideoxygalactose transaminase
MKISNRPTQVTNDKFNFYSFVSAREAFKHILSLPENAGKKLLLPAFIGQSDREGSGVFDPVRETKTNYEFYKMDARLNIDPKDFAEKIAKNPSAIVLFIHYWGFKDPRLEEWKKLSKKNGLVIVEDFAHGLFTFFKEPVVNFDFGFFSLHKMFAYPDGGILISSQSLPGLVDYNNKFFEFNLADISEKRVTNYKNILEKFKKKMNFHITLIRSDLADNVPQTFPILLSSNTLKDKLYFKMNEAGFGVTSLYHQMINEVDETFVNERNVSSCILNLPVHQDIKLEDLNEMIILLNKICDEHV